MGDINCPAFEQDHSAGVRVGNQGVPGCRRDVSKGMVAGTRGVVAQFVAGQ